MNILINTIRIAGFRGIKNLELEFPRITVLIGINNSGKTSVLNAMQLALGDYSRYISDEDFYIDADENRVNEILVDVKIVAVDDNGQRKPSFDDEWMEEFGDKIQSEVNGYQFFALRTRCKPDLIKGSFETLRFTLEKWSEFATWQTDRLKESKLTTRFQSIPFISIEAQRDIQQELKEKSSFAGRVLSKIVYKPEEVQALEELIQEVNNQAVNQSPVLQSLKSNLENLNQSFQGSGYADITPFPKKIRDLSKYFSVQFGETESNTFSMEYHGMGTRSWASMLTVKTFTDLTAEKHREEVKPFFPILAAEEPEAHLHPNAQKTLYRQLADHQGQVIISTHSPYLAAMAQQSEIRYLKKTFQNIEVKQLNPQLDDEEKRKIQREVIHSRGEILFSKALVLCEGETEEQALPLLFQKYFGREAFVLGISFIGVGGGGNYLPFLKFSNSFSIPTFILSDGEQQIINKLKEDYENIYGNVDINNCANICILEDTDFEGYLLLNGFREQIETTIIKLEGAGFIENWIERNHGQTLKRQKTNQPKCSVCNQFIFENVLRDYRTSDGYDKALNDILDKGKGKFSPVIAEEICKLDPENFPPKIIELFEKIKAGAGI